LPLSSIKNKKGAINTKVLYTRTTYKLFYRFAIELNYIIALKKSKINNPFENLAVNDLVPEYESQEKT
jgi:hypothetical protein